MDMNLYQQIFALFYAIMWGSLANVWNKWRPFDWSRMGEGEHSLARTMLSLFMLNLLPILFFIYMFLELGSSKLSGTCFGMKLFVVMLQPFSLIGFYGVWVAIIQWFRPYFYPPEPLSERRFPRLYEIDLNKTGAPKSFISGLGYVLVPTILMKFVSCLSP